MVVTHARLYATPDGESHMDELRADLAPTDFAPPAPPLHLSEPRSATSVRFLVAPPGWVGELHPSPRRQIFVVLSGTMEGTASDGSVRTFGPGQALLMEDTFGRGHASRVVGSEPVTSMIISLQ
jgi:quercetin dioxygenase-like cupin family protein